MGRLTQFIEYLNIEKHPSGDELKSKYTHITVDDGVKKIRKEYQKNIKRQFSGIKK